MRHPDWQARLWARIEEGRQAAPQWGTHDCVMFATGCIDAVMGTDYYAQAKVRYPYSTESQAIELMQQFGGITGLVGSFLGSPVNWGQLGIGDVVLVGIIPHVTHMETLCVHDGAQLVGAGSKGIARAPFRYAIHGWAIR